MSKARDLRRRIDAISVAIQGTFIARFARLSDAERAAYHLWRRRSDEWYASLPQWRAYQAILDGERPPALARVLREKLFGASPRITTEMTTETAADLYARFARGV